MEIISRRTALAGALSMLTVFATGCAPRSDQAAVQAALQSAVDAVPGYVGGTIQYQDGFSPGTTISAVLTVTATDREGTAEVLSSILEAVIRTYVDQPDVRTGFVRISASPEGDQTISVNTADIVKPSEGANATTDDVASHFKLS
ncbi:hypothetical protein [Rothia halotolerans]|uniref:hypothetical protein n=1 Tax=Rothia halotolerans TaxID=405770 RepID=UPI001EDE061E|nr:hypothetical protein [Rothia halotolerans]